MWEAKHHGEPEEDEELLAALASIGRKGKGRGPGRAAARADDDDMSMGDDDGDDMGMSGYGGALKQTYRAARPVSANEDGMEIDLDEEAAMGLGMVGMGLAKAAAAPKRRGGAKAAVKDDDGEGITRDDGDEKIEIGFGWVTHGAAPNQVLAPEEEWDEVDDELMERTVRVLLRLHIPLACHARLARCTPLARPFHPLVQITLLKKAEAKDAKKKARDKRYSTWMKPGDYEPQQERISQGEDLAGFMSDMLAGIRTKTERRRSMRRASAATNHARRLSVTAVNNRRASITAPTEDERVRLAKLASEQERLAAEAAAEAKALLVKAAAATKTRKATTVKGHGRRMSLSRALAATATTISPADAAAAEREDQAMLSWLRSQPWSADAPVGWLDTPSIDDAGLSELLATGLPFLAVADWLKPGVVAWSGVHSTCETEQQRSDNCFAALGVMKELGFKDAVTFLTI